MDYNEEKATAVAAYLLGQAGGELNDLKLMKLMYLAEREAIRQRNVGITGDQFFSMQNGPILSQTLNLMYARSPGLGLWTGYIHASHQRHVKLVRPLVVDGLLSVREQEILERTWAEYGSRDKWELVDLTHTFPEWDRRAHDFRTSIAIAAIDLLEALGFESAEIDSRLAETRAADAMDHLLGGTFQLDSAIHG